MSAGKVKGLNVTGKEPVEVQQPRRIKLLATASIFIGNICLGFCSTSFAPILLDLTAKYNVQLDTMSFAFTIMNIGYLFGALSTNLIYRIFPRQVGVTILLFGFTLGFLLTPHCPTILIFFGLAGLIGICTGAYDTSQIVWMLELWESESGPYVQAQYLFYAIGTFVPPLVIAPFLRSSGEQESDSKYSTLTTNSPVHDTIPDLWIPFTILGGVACFAASFQVYLFIFHRYHPLTHKSKWDSNSDLPVPVTQEDSTSKRRLKFQLIGISGIFIAAYIGMELCTGQFLPTFAQVGSLKLTASDATYLSSGLSGTMTLGRALGIFIILKVSPGIMLIANFGFLLAGNTILLVLGQSWVWALWLGVIALGIGFSTTYACFCAYIETHLKFTDAVGSFLMICGTVTASLYPILVGSLIEENPRVLTYVIFFSIPWIILSFGMIYKLTSKRII